VIDGEPEERAKARALTAHGDVSDRTVVYETHYITTGVPRAWSEDDRYAAKPDVSESVSSGPPPLEREVRPVRTGRTAAAEAQQVFDIEEAANESNKVSPIYIWTTIRHGDGGDDPGEIAEGMYSVEGGAVVLTDRDGRHITSRALLGEDPATLARQLLREIRKRADFNRRLRYPPLSVA
jgi:hypothetical protein